MNLEGKKAPAFCLKDINDRSHNLQDYIGNWLLLVFHRHLS